MCLVFPLEILRKVPDKMFLSLLVIRTLYNVLLVHSLSFLFKIKFQILAVLAETPS